MKILKILFVLSATLLLWSCSSPKEDINSRPPSITSFVSEETPQEEIPEQESHNVTAPNQITAHTQKDTGLPNEEIPTLSLDGNGGFTLKCNTYDGYVVFDGDYHFDGSVYVMTVSSCSALSGPATEIKGFSFYESESGLIYSGEPVGLTIEGSVFE